MTAYDWFALTAILVCLLLSAFFSSSAAALTAISRSRSGRLDKPGNRQAVLVNQLLKARDRVLGVLSFGNNVVRVVAISLAAGLMLAWCGSIGVLYAIVAMAILIGVFTEVLPRRASAHAPDRVALAVAWPVAITLRLFGPLLGAVDAWVHGLLGFAGLRHDEHDVALLSHDDTRASGDGPHRENGVEKLDRDMFGGVLDLRELEVSDVMIHRTKMIMLDADLSPEKAVQEVLAAPVTRLPLWRDKPENIVGLLHAKDLLRALQAVGGDASKIDIMAIATPPWFVPDTTPLYEQLKTFRRRQTPIALVVDEYGEVMGLVTLEDILEEIVGDMTDEHDVAISGVRPQPDGSVNVDGGVPIRDLNRAMDWHLPDAEATTVAGLVIHEARSIPEPGQSFTFHGFRFRVLRKSRNRITALRITPLVRKAVAKAS
jgi:Mg2+/Co2+ transporter CorB